MPLAYTLESVGYTDTVLLTIDEPDIYQHKSIKLRDQTSLLIGFVSQTGWLRSCKGNFITGMMHSLPNFK